MNKKFFKVAFAGAAVFGFAVAAFATNTPNASAKSYAKVKSNSALSYNVEERNYLPNGSAALYSKAGTLKGARMVAGKSTMGGLNGKTDAGQSYFRAYRSARTNRGSYYLKVVSFDKQYRGWIYAGKTNPTKGSGTVGGLKNTATFTRGSVTTDIANTTYYFKGSSQTYVQPDWTQYKVGRNLKSTQGNYSKDALKVTGVGAKTNGRDNNAVYYYVEDSSNPSVNGWIKSDNLTSSATGSTSSSSSATIAQNQVAVNYVDSKTNNTITSKTLTNTNSASQTAAAFLGNNTAGQAVSNIPSGYQAPATGTANETANNAALTAAQYGKSVNFIVDVKSAGNLFATTPKFTTLANNRPYSGLPGDAIGKNAFVSPGQDQINNLITKLASDTNTSTNNGVRDTFTAQDIVNALNDTNLKNVYYLTYCDPLSSGSKTIMTASSTAVPSVSGLFSSSGSTSSSGDLSSILGSAGLGGIGSILGGIGNTIGNSLSSIADWLFGGSINYRLVQLTTSEPAIKKANGDAIKVGTQVTIPYTATASGVLKEKDIKLMNNQFDGKNFTAGNDQQDAFSASSFSSSTDSLTNLLNNASSSTTAGQAASVKGTRKM
ncbi:MAG: hypothetical protein ABF679_09905 [Lentilactobacillus diolivorans]|uniref:hypothetical protein n=1 Tax=Lentilactobacillus diolivorans TaxID=179838 RepID=UPI0039E9C154